MVLPRGASCHDNWLPSALWPCAPSDLIGSWGCDRHSADCVSEGPGCGTGCLVSSLCPRTHERTHYFFVQSHRAVGRKTCLCAWTRARSLTHKNPHIAKLLIYTYRLHAAVHLMVRSCSIFAVVPSLLIQ